MANLNILSHQKKVQQLSDVLYMIERNQNYLRSLIKDSQSTLLLSYHGSEYYRNKIDFRGEIHNRLVCYYAKKLAAVASDAYEHANNIIKPKQIQHGINN